MEPQKNHNPTEKEMEYRKAIHLLQDACDDQLILMSNKHTSVYLIPSILGKGHELEGNPPGTVEYQVSNGPIGGRSISNDYYHLEGAVDAFNILVNKGGF